jgi:hypothetical protein
LYQNSLISSSQHGFLPGRSTTTQLLLSLNTLTEHFDNKQNVDVVYTDFSKAFDKVCHNKLIEVLSSYGIKGTVLNWIRNFIKFRTQSVYIENEISDTVEISSGVPQGSVLGPLLFLLYVQDIEKTCSPGCAVSLFADDCKFLSIHPYALQNSLDSMVTFVSARQMKLSKDKCLHLSINRKGSSNSFYLEGEQIQKVDSVRDLGITLRNDLTWKTHICNIVQKAFYTAHKILYSFSTNNLRTLLRAYKVFVRPLLEHNSVIWSPYFIGDIKKIESIQKFFTKKLFQRCGLTSYNYEQLQYLNLKSLETRRQIFDLVMVYKILFNYIDIDASKLFSFKPSQYSLRGHKFILNKPKFSILATQNSFSSRVVRVWNALPESVVLSSSPAVFKSRLRDLDLIQLRNSSYR